jgi:hypothetical protein
VTSYIYQPEARITFAEGVRALRDQGREVVTAPVDITEPSVVDRVRALGLDVGMAFEDFVIDVPACRSYYETVGYTFRMPPSSTRSTPGSRSLTRRNHEASGTSPLLTNHTRTSL